MGAELRRHGRRKQPIGRAEGAQARPARRMLLAVVLLAGGCVGTPAEGPVEFLRNIRGDGLNGREAPPGLDGAYPNLARVPPRPERPPAAARDALSAALLREREMAGAPIRAGQPVPPRPPGLEGSMAVPETAPAPVALTAAPRVPWEVPAPAPRGAPAAVPVPARPALPAPATPTAPPATRVPSPSATPRAPAAATAPPAVTMPDAPPPPPAELLAPGAIPAPPPADLLAPRP